MAELEIFEPEIYLLNDRKNNYLISKYISNFRSGILMDHKPLLFLLLGSYADKVQNNFVLRRKNKLQKHSNPIE